MNGNLSNRTPLGRFEVVDVAARFAAKYQADGECWRWTGAIDQTGCGRFWFDGRMDEAHRVAYRLYIGPIPERWVVRQSCRNRACVNPAHLEVAPTPRKRQASGRSWANIYETSEWKRARAAALARDGHRCTVSRFFGQSCSGVLHVHHIIPLKEGGQPFDLDNLGTACARHHSKWEALRREVMRELSADLRHAVSCPHRHRTTEARRICERRLERQRQPA